MGLSLHLYQMQEYKYDSHIHKISSALKSSPTGHGQTTRGD